MVKIVFIIALHDRIFNCRIRNREPANEIVIFSIKRPKTFHDFGGCLSHCHCPLPVLLQIAFLRLHTLQFCCVYRCAQFLLLLSVPDRQIVCLPNSGQTYYYNEQKHYPDEKEYCFLLVHIASNFLSFFLLSFYKYFEYCMFYVCWCKYLFGFPQLDWLEAFVQNEYFAAAFLYQNILQNAATPIEYLRAKQ